MEIERAAERGFTVAADIYERGRPGYPSAAIDRLAAELAVGPKTEVIEVGAGTGKFTGELKTRGAEVIAVEPVAAMRSKLRQRHPGVPIIAGVAEALPVRDHAVEVVVCAQAFHWFDGLRSLAEFHRVLKPRGRLGLIWNVRDETCDWSARITELMAPYTGDTPRFRSGRWREAFTDSCGFTPLHSAHYPHQHRGTPDLIRDRFMSVSFIAALPESEKRAFAATLNELLSTHPDLRGKDSVDFPYETVVYWCTARGGE